MKKWIWMIGNNFDDDKYKKSFEKLKKLGISQVLLNSNEATLENLLPIATQMDIKIHRWLITLLKNDKEIIYKHHDWFTINRLGESSADKPQYVNYYKWLCPNNPEVQEYILKKVEALSKISEISGVHLDYIRYCDVILPRGIQPDYNLIQTEEKAQFDYCYCPHCRERFKNLTNIDPVDSTDPSKNKEWLQFRYNSITKLVNKIAVIARSNSKFISAAVFPTHMQKNVRQQWHRWDVDAVFPMMYHSFYNEDINWIEAETKRGVELLDNTALYSGLYIPSIKPQSLSKAEEKAKIGGAEGVSYFNFDALQNYKIKMSR